MSSKRAVEAARATTATNAAIALNQESSMQPEVAEAYREAAAGPTNALDVLEQVANTAPPKKPSTTATKSEPKRCAKEGCKLYAQQPSEFCSNHKPAVGRELWQAMR